MRSLIDEEDKFFALSRMNVSRETVDKLDEFIELLQIWSKITNLISSAEWPRLWTRHIYDSAQLINLAPHAKRWCDLGTGAGFPGLILAILLTDRAGATFTLIESNKRKAAFLSEVGRKLSLNVFVDNRRIQQALLDLPSAPDIVTARALAPLRTLLEMTAPLIKKGTVALFLKGQSIKAELTPEIACDTFSFQVLPSLTAPEGNILKIQSK